MSDSLPPGVTPDMIPGNTPEDAEWDRLYDWIAELGLEPSEIRALLSETKLAETEGGDGCVMVPTQLLHTEWPPTPQLAPGHKRFDAVYESLLAGAPIREPLTVRYDNWTVIDGHHRIAAARLAGIAMVPVRFWTGAAWVPSGGPDPTAADPERPDRGDAPRERRSGTEQRMTVWGDRSKQPRQEFDRRSSEDVRGADVREAQELAEWVVMFDESRNADGSPGDDSDMVYHDMVKCARESLTPKPTVTNRQPTNSNAMVWDRGVNLTSRPAASPVPPIANIGNPKKQ
jgi:hypothetical protein